jgi:hypothetical protein
MSDITAEQVKAGQAPYNRLLLAVYDPYVRFNYRFLWGCRPRQVLDLYNEHVSANHLDVGVATGGSVLFWFNVVILTYSALAV